MKKKKQNQKNYIELFKWINIITFIITFIYLYYFYKNNNLLIKLSINTLIFFIIISTFSITKLGFKIIQKIKKIKNELNKIIWPNKKETLYTTFIICIITITISLFLWGLDNILFYITSFIIKLRF